PEPGQRAAVAGCEAGDPDQGGEDGPPHPGRAEEDAPRLERDEEEHRAEQARLVPDDGRRIDAGETCDQGEEAVPERERVTGVQATVPELVDGAERERAEVVELAHPAEMEEPVALHGPGQMPERDPER